MKPLPLILGALLAAGALPALAADPADRAAILADLSAQAKAADPAFAGFSAERGRTLFLTDWAGGDAKTPACAACHTRDPRQTGRNAKTGRPIDPMAVSANPARFTDAEEVAKQFNRDCPKVLGRDCSPTEKGDFITFMESQ